MEEQEKAAIAKQFIETILEVPVATCRPELSAMEEAVRQYIPEFLTSQIPFFITETMRRSFEPMVLYHITDFIRLNFNLFLYRNGKQDEIMIVGPYLLHQPDQRFCEEVLQENGLTASLIVPFYEYCLTLPVAGNSAMLLASRTALKVITGCEEEVPYRHYQPQAEHQKEAVNISTYGMEEAAMELLEQRYRYEKLMLQEVAQGNADMALSHYRQFFMASRSIVRTEDPVRTSKNLGFSLNTMLRKSAETAGIHPVYLDIISSNFAMLIENSNKLKEIEEFKFQMISAYCRFVQKYRLDDHSPLVRKAITYIRVHLSDHLSLRQIASGIKVSPSYLSRIFNQEMGESISCFITRTRIEKAAELLSFTRMPIQNVAFYVGFSDLNYFSRCFKKQMGKTPTEYRTESAIG